MLYEVITLLVQDIFETEPAPLEASNPAIPPQLQELIKGMLAKTYEERLESMHGIRELV